MGTVLLDRSDIVRHPLVQAIVNAYELAELAAERDGHDRGDKGREPAAPEAGRPADPPAESPASPTASE